ncbi:hypothetical protein J7337_013929 [Fusarium musae]|uniref:Uncharacterized protein n=1 Tax=Fusarium musae TaxID=1042133 RepID=A0A9P8D3Q8_9HYPO|nr:hypothetical protein J7337_013929 [Fusarium musae]KAG9494790.1 hypothetical protein J7337_013929 [Fusarium musae]
MVRNDPGAPFRRMGIVDRASPCRIQVNLLGTIHGSMSPDKEPATLLLFKFRFSAERLNGRIKSVKITVQFYEENSDPIVANIAPDGSSQIERSTQETTVSSDIEAGVNAGVGMGLSDRTVQKKTDSVTIDGMQSIRGRNYGSFNTVIWRLTENSTLHSGIPAYLQSAVLLKRSTGDSFSAKFDIEAEVSGFLFRDIQAGLQHSEEDPIILNIPAPPKWPPGMQHPNSNALGSIDLSSLAAIGPLTTVTSDWENQKQEETIQQQAASGLVEPGILVDSKSETRFIDVWGMRPPVEAQTRLPDVLAKEDLEKDFSWIFKSLKPPVVSIDKDGNKRILNEQSGDNEFYNLICQISTDGDGSKVRNVYIAQTPFYTSGFWSLVLYSMTDLDMKRHTSRLSGVIQTDAGVDLSTVLSEVQKLAGKHGRHQSLLPIQLFKVHFAETLKTLKDVQEKIAEVDKDLSSQYEQDSKLEKATKLYKKSSKVLHECSRTLADLRRRRSFEEDLGNQIREGLQKLVELRRQRSLKDDDIQTYPQKDARSDYELAVMMDLYSKMSKGLDLDIEALPGTIESQRNVLFNLITQQDSFVQSRLAGEALRDSKEMKTLSILTILFLPGAFVATVFSTNMFKFESNGQQIWIYFAIVAPLTVALMVGWILWLKLTPQGADEETGDQPGLEMAKEIGKGSKND